MSGASFAAGPLVDKENNNALRSSSASFSIVVPLSRLSVGEAMTIMLAARSLSAVAVVCHDSYPGDEGGNGDEDGPGNNHDSSGGGDDGCGGHLYEKLLSFFIGVVECGTSDAFLARTAKIATIATSAASAAAARLVRGVRARPGGGGGEGGGGAKTATGGSRGASRAETVGRRRRAVARGARLRRDRGDGAPCEDGVREGGAARARGWGGARGRG